MKINPTCITFNKNQQNDLLNASFKVNKNLLNEFDKIKTKKGERLGISKQKFINLNNILNNR